MIRYLKNLDAFHKNIILVFIGSFSVSFLNLLYQFLIAHRLSPSDFAATNSLLSICMLISMPLSALQTLVAKYTSEFNAQANTEKIKEVISSILRRALQFALLTFFVFFI
ncbi:MAG: hypothetical protein HZA27_01950, partial [Candidatus Omnitrophica bacterium]|nr:hypothetical protein [Candidatus Omnitrophota bacterium]